MKARSTSNKARLRRNGNTGDVPGAFEAGDRRTGFRPPANHAIDKLAAMQNVRPLESASKLATVLPDDEDLDAMLAVIYSSRK